MASHPKGTTDHGGGPPRITVVSRCFPPAHLSGGPARSLAGLVEAFGSEYRLSVIASATDDPKEGCMAGVQPDQWSDIPGAHVWYNSQRRLSPRRMRGLLRETRPDLIYLNSVFDFQFSIMPLVVARLSVSDVPVLLAPRGELSTGALAFKRRKKRMFLACCRLLHLYRFVEWHASNEFEVRDIQRALHPVSMYGELEAIKVHKAENLRSRSGMTSLRRRETVDDCNLELVPSLVFFSRIVPKKNLIGLLAALPDINRDVILTIAGPQEDAQYWAKCSRLIEQLPPGRRAIYHGVVGGADVVSFLSEFDLFVLPTFGENFGHVVLEAITAGTPVIVGQDTPWQVIEDRGAGWLCDPKDQKQLASLVQRFIDMSLEQREAMRTAASKLADHILADPVPLQAHRTMFNSVLKRDRI